MDLDKRIKYNIPIIQIEITYAAMAGYRKNIGI